MVLIKEVIVTIVAIVASADAAHTSIIMMSPILQGYDVVEYQNLHPSAKGVKSKS